MILGQLRIGERQTTFAGLVIICTWVTASYATFLSHASHRRAAVDWGLVAGCCFEVSAELPRQKVKVKSAMCCKMRHFVPTYSGSMANEWQTSAFSKYSTKFICFHTGHKRKENWKAFTLMATKCLFKILYQIYLFPHRSQKKEKIKGFH